MHAYMYTDKHACDVIYIYTNTAVLSNSVVIFRLYAYFLANQVVI